MKPEDVKAIADKAYRSIKPKTARKAWRSNITALRDEIGRARYQNAYETKLKEGRSGEAADIWSNWTEFREHLWNWEPPEDPDV